MRLLFVCTGNICRSPTAEAVFRKRLADRGGADLLGPVAADSAGTQALLAGQPPEPRARRIAEARGYTLSGMRARIIGHDDLDRADLVMALDRTHLAALRRLAAPEQLSKLRLLLDYAPRLGRRDVPDPYGGSDAAFAAVLDLIEAGVDGLIESLLRGENPAAP